MADFVMDNEDDFLTNQDPHPYLFEPEHTEEELQVLEEERARERLRLLNSQELRRDSELAWTGGVVVGRVANRPFKNGIIQYLETKLRVPYWAKKGTHFVPYFRENQNGL